MTFLDYYLQVTKLYDWKKPSEALLINHELILDLFESGRIDHTDRDCLVNANHMAYDAYTRFPKEVTQNDK